MGVILLETSVMVSSIVYISLSYIHSNCNYFSADNAYMKIILVFITCPHDVQATAGAEQLSNMSSSFQGLSAWDTDAFIGYLFPDSYRCKRHLQAYASCQ